MTEINHGLGEISREISGFLGFEIGSKRKKPASATGDLKDVAGSLKLEHVDEGVVESLCAAIELGVSLCKGSPEVGDFLNIVDLKFLSLHK